MAIVNEEYGAYYFDGKQPETNHSREHDLYTYKAYAGKHTVTVAKGDSVIYLAQDATVAMWYAGPVVVKSEAMAVVIRGYHCGNKSMDLKQAVNLPYVNGCATRQLFPPERIGDPTFQQLTIPPFTSEQVHHIHPTTRVVYVLSGRGYSIVGQSEKTDEVELLPGMVVVLDPMSPHHFRTEGESLTVLPVHVFSSTPASMESNHPMFNGTKEV